MNVGLHDADRNDFPNYALMKLSAFHKQQGDAVEWWLPYKEYSTRSITVLCDPPYDEACGKYEEVEA